MVKVFLSHSSVDKPFVRKIKRALLPFGAQGWLDENELYPGDKLWPSISKEIKVTDSALVFVSNDSVGSEWVQKEVRKLLKEERSKKGPRIIPILFTDTPPDFLSDRLHVNFKNRSFAEGIRDILKGVYRDQSVMVLTPENDKPATLPPFIGEIQGHKKAGQEGSIKIVYDIYEFIESVDKSLIPDSYGSSERIRIAFPHCIDLLTALTPQLIKTLYKYCGHDAGASPKVEETIRLVWRLVTLPIYNYLKPLIDRAKLTPNAKIIYEGSIVELNLLESTTASLLAPQDSIDTLRQTWFEHLKVPLKNTHDIGFVGSTDLKIADATHIRIPEADIRHDSLEFSGSTPPDHEFMPYTWIENVLPFIVADAVLHYGFKDIPIHEIVQHIGMLKTDYTRFGIE